MTIFKTRTLVLVPCTGTRSETTENYSSTSTVLVPRCSRQKTWKEEKKKQIADLLVIVTALLKRVVRSCVSISSATGREDLHTRFLPRKKRTSSLNSNRHHNTGNLLRTVGVERSLSLSLLQDKKGWLLLMPLDRL